MELFFASRKLRKQLTSSKAMRKAFGNRAPALQRRLAILMAADCLADVPPTPPERCHPLKGRWAGCFAVDISANWRIVFRPIHDPPLLPDGGPDVKRITAIEIVAITDYH